MHIPQTEIILRHEGSELARVTLPPGEYVIGRDRDAPIHAETPLLSRQHARLTINCDHLLLEDLGSSNGTFINEQPVTEATRLFPNQAIRLGDIAIEVRRQRAPSDPDLTLTPTQSAIRRHLPDELLAEKRYAIGSVVAQGGMGAILDARQTAIDRTVAMKVMLETGDEAGVLRFIDEAKITGQLDHPNIVPIYELGVDDQGQLFYTMKMVRGITLKKVLELIAAGDAETAKKYPLPALLTIFQKVCDALAFAHSKGVIHRDLKPENLMLGDFGSVLVMDWGLAKVVVKDEGGRMKDEENGRGPDVIHTARSAPESSSFRLHPSSFATLAGSILGTPQYMSPEQARGEVETLDARSDIYALGAILFHILALRPPVSGASALEIVEKVQRGEVEPLECGGKRQRDTALAGAERRGGAPEHPGAPRPAKAESALRSATALQKIPDSLAAVVRQAMAFDKAARYPSAEALQTDLLAYQNGFATSAEKAGAWKQATLFVKRHKAVSIASAAALVIIVTGSAAFTTRVIDERDRANRALGDLRNAAPTLASEARKLIDEQKFDDALLRIRFAAGIEPRNADYRLLLAQVLQARLELPPAAEEFRRVLTLIPSDSAHENLALCERLLRDYPPPAELDHPAIRALQQQMEKEGRFTQAAPLATKLGESKKAIEAILQAKLIAWRRIPGWDKRPGGRSLEMGAGRHFED